MELIKRFINLNETIQASVYRNAGVYQVLIDDLESGLSLPWSLYRTLDEACQVARLAVSDNGVPAQ